MSTRLTGLLIEAREPAALAGFWAALLGWEAVGAETVRAPVSDGELELAFVPESGPKVGLNRLHLDLASTSPEAQRAKVSQAVELGARPKDIGQGAVPWDVLADPEDNEFCVLEPRPGYTTTEALAAIVVNSRDPLVQATFWEQATGWRIAARQPVIVGLRSPAGRGPWLEFLSTEEEKVRPNRFRLRVTATVGGDAKPETDPEGNEFVVVA
ncbi:VOC family protein [Amycolatopsis acidicola]|uniref:VOC family protein n=1 Tax=Amycolatopsis acidicola TaxID=2596893 RepID=A0A5N0V2B5_9PSEU|nr:VOC family protein [Amycolatopsis acidicola]KAA9159974.1 VOC family protein [Amycolatopsis acidicola]